MNLNHLVLSGNLTRDPEIRSVGADKSVTNFTVAHNTKYKTGEGELREEVAFVDCDAWGKPGELVAQYLTKGSLVILEGSLRTDQWTDKEGQKRSRLKLRVERVHFAPRGRTEGGADGGAGEGADEGAYGEPASPRALAAPRPNRTPAGPRPVNRTSTTTEAPPF
jgi:single-strand DNA-binding protein